MKKLTLLLSLSVASCSFGHDFDITGADRLRPHLSSEADARRELGEPLSVQQNPTNGHKALIWRYTHSTSGKSLIISFDEEGKMLSILSRTNLN